MNWDQDIIFILKRTSDGAPQRLYLTPNGIEFISKDRVFCQNSYHDIYLSFLLCPNLIKGLLNIPVTFRNVENDVSFYLWNFFSNSDVISKP